MSDKRVLKGLTAGSLLIQEIPNGKVRIESLLRGEILYSDRNELLTLRDLLTEFLDS